MKTFLPTLLAWLFTIGVLATLAFIHERRADARAHLMAPPLVHLNSR